jgi:hypothetical protein
MIGCKTNISLEPTHRNVDKSLNYPNTKYDFEIQTLFILVLNYPSPFCGHVFNITIKSNNVYVGFKY